ncbi:hypothetical protein KPH14_007641 [Odynerus spinipes]|uniref:Reverse transcriptase Ty1/copia-type domain-containing protein n=1 Tax=Odynerus spinipes TaxID=1348599 RepID=A0AAD9VM83_9HYME|nr:hypothetical protein KPH14_007641 [Odynerus spinipes]
MRRKLDPKDRKTIFVGYDRYTDNVYRVYNVDKKVVERVADVKIEDVNSVDSTLFPLSIEEEEEDYDECIIQENCTRSTDSDDQYEDAEENSTVSVSQSPEVRKKLGRPPGAKSKSNPVAPSGRVLRDRTKKISHINAMKVSIDPISYEDAMSRDDAHSWKQALDDEMSSILQNETWDLVSLPAEKPVVSCRWIFKTKLHPDGTIKRYKARLVARGFSQTEGIDYFETFSPVVRYESVKTILAICSC